MRTVAGSIHYSMDIGQEVISTAILSLPLIQVGQFVSYWLSTGLSLPRNIVIRLNDRLDMTIVVHWDVKPHIKQTKQTQHTSVWNLGIF